MPTNTTNLSASQPTHPPVTIHQGPDWLVWWYLNPPGWVNSFLKLLALVTALLVVYRLYQSDWTIDLETQREMQLVVAHIVAIATATLAMVNLLEQPYLVDVSLGFAVGYTTVFAPQTRFLTFPWPVRLSDPVDRTIALWFLLAVAAYALPALVNVNARGIPLGQSRLLLAVGSLSMVFYNGVRESD